MKTAMWQTGTAVVQAVCSIVLLAWYVLAAHLERQRVRREKVDEFASLVRLCRDLGIEAKDKTNTHLRAASAALAGASSTPPDPRLQLASWRADMTIIYVCLNEVPHYEVRSPAFSTALTRLWLEVDARTVEPEHIDDLNQWVAFLDHKFQRICLEVDAMAGLLVTNGTLSSQGWLGRSGGVQRRGYKYGQDGFPQERSNPLYERRQALDDGPRPPR